MSYTPPQGYYDLPFTWVYDASGLTDGASYPNQYVYLQGGYGDFVLRRLVGIDRVLNPATGLFQIRDRFNAPTVSALVQSQNVTDQAILPELFYPETGAIKFDLYNILRETDQTQVNPIYSSQLAFQGVRRMKGTNPFAANYKYKPKPFWYQINTTLPPAQNADGTPTGRLTVYQKINDYPFELWEIKIIYGGGSLATGVLFLIEGARVIVTSKLPGTAGNAITVTLATSGANQPISIDVVGTVITVNLATDIFGQPISTAAEVAAIIASTPAAAALVSTLVQIDGGLNAQSITLAGGGAGSGSSCNSALLVYDQDKTTIQSAPILDVFVNSIATKPNGTPYLNNGAIVPPLLYRKDSQLQIDIQSLSASSLPMTVYLIGRQRYPC